MLLSVIFLKQICFSDSHVHDLAKAMHFPACSPRQDLKSAPRLSCLAAADFLLLSQAILVHGGCQGRRGALAVIGVPRFTDEKIQAQRETG